MLAALGGRRDCRILACLNPHSYITASHDDNFRGALLKSEWLVPDGIGIVWGTKVLGNSVKERITGFDVFKAVMTQLDSKGGSVFYLGSTQGVLDKIESKMAKTYPGVTLAGLYSPPFKSDFSSVDNAKMIEAVNSVKPDVLWVGMTAPKQEKWLNIHRGSLKVNVAGAIGAVFDFFAGNSKRAPMIMQRIGLEWVHRSIISPSRLGKRNLASNPKFVLDILRHKLAQLRD